MRVVWKDSAENSRINKPVRYRKHMVTWYNEGTRNRGWITDVPGDKYVYRTIDMACNAIDKLLGTPPRKNNDKRQKKGIVIVCEKKGMA